MRPVSRKRQVRDRDYQAAREAVYERCEGVCERCNRAGVTDIHHLAGRTGPNPHRLANLAGFCRPCHNWVHQNPAEAREQGWMRSRLGLDSRG
jgi:5-methylcytosine-specific restriction endonuclease McrA